MQRLVFGAMVLVACSAGDSDAGGDSPAFMGSSPTASGAAGGSPSGAAGASGVAGAGGQGSSAPAASEGAGVGSAGDTGSGNEGNTNVGAIAPGSGPGNSGSGSAAAGNSGAGNSGAGAGSAGAASAGASGEPATPPGGASSDGEPPPDSSQPSAAGPFVSRTVNGGASAAFVCPKGVAFGNPLDGMGAVQSVSAPNTSFFAFIEGPVWVGSVGRLFFSDNASGPERIWQLTPPSTTPEIFLADSGSNGLAVDNADQLLLADQSDRRITRVSSSTGASLGEVLPSGQHTPNDLIMRSDDNVYFSDPNTAGRGLYRVAPSGELSGPFTQANAANAPNAPNGVELSPDENTLYVGDVQQRFVAKFPLLADGAIDTANGAVFVRTTGDTVDGMAVDCAGNLYVGTRTGIEVYAPDARFIGTVPTGESSNATFGGADRRTLFVTSRSVLKFVQLGVPGLPD